MALWMRKTNYDKNYYFLKKSSINCHWMNSSPGHALPAQPGLPWSICNTNSGTVDHQFTESGRHICTCWSGAWVSSESPTMRNCCFCWKPACSLRPSFDTKITLSSLGWIFRRMSPSGGLKKSRLGTRPFVAKFNWCDIACSWRREDSLTSLRSWHDHGLSNWLATGIVKQNNVFMQH